MQAWQTQSRQGAAQGRQTPPVRLAKQRAGQASWQVELKRKQAEMQEVQVEGERRQLLQMGAHGLQVVEFWKEPLGHSAQHLPWQRKRVLLQAVHELLEHSEQPFGQTTHWALPVSPKKPSGHWLAQHRLPSRKQLLPLNTRRQAVQFVESREQERHGAWQASQMLLLPCWKTPAGQEAQQTPPQRRAGGMQAKQVPLLGEQVLQLAAQATQTPLLAQWLGGQVARQVPLEKAVPVRQAVQAVSLQTEQLAWTQAMQMEAERQLPRGQLRQQPFPKMKVPLRQPEQLEADPLQAVHSEEQGEQTSMPELVVWKQARGQALRQLALNSTVCVDQEQQVRHEELPGVEQERQGVSQAAVGVNSAQSMRLTLVVVKMNLRLLLKAAGLVREKVTMQQVELMGKRQPVVILVGAAQLRRQAAAETRSPVGVATRRETAPGVVRLRAKEQVVGSLRKGLVWLPLTLMALGVLTSSVTFWLCLAQLSVLSQAVMFSCGEPSYARFTMFTWNTVTPEGSGLLMVTTPPTPQLTTLVEQFGCELAQKPAQAVRTTLSPAATPPREMVATPGAQTMRVLWRTSTQLNFLSCVIASEALPSKYTSELQSSCTDTAIGCREAGVSRLPIVTEAPLVSWLPVKFSMELAKERRVAPVSETASPGCRATGMVSRTVQAAPISKGNEKETVQTVAEPVTVLLEATLNSPLLSLRVVAASEAQPRSTVCQSDCVETVSEQLPTC